MINEDGIYQISYQLEGIAKSTGTFNFNAILLVNGTPISDTLNEGPVIVENIGNNRMTLTSTVILKLNAGDVLQLGGLSQENVTYKNTFYFHMDMKVASLALAKGSFNRYANCKMYKKIYNTLNFKIILLY